MKHRFAIICLFSLLPILLSLSCSKPAIRTKVEDALAELGSLDEQAIPGYLESLERKDPIAPFYRDASTREPTLLFFTSLTQSETVARDILDNSEKFGVRPSLAFALALEESDFHVDAMNKNGDSVDRGLFQLNSKSYPKLEIRDFYDPSTNARYGISHLKGCLSEAGNEVAALAMYNAGNGRVERGATPQKTLNYVSRILAYEDNISSLFAAKVMAASRPSAPGLARLFAESVSVGLVSNATARKD
jgi:Soluble lytic murein transglycosylase and related regulatory proteins (some contain LysM/invasin domains)